jgi:lambda family phage minor tail protein L
MTTPQTITSEIQKLEPSAIIELFELDATAFGGDLLRFHAGTNGLRQNLVWQGNTYTAFPVQATGFDYSGNGQLPRPKLQVANITGAISMLVLQYDDLLGAKITRKRTLAKYLDAVNFPGGSNPSADPMAEFADDIFQIDRKVTENRDIVEFELAAAFDVAGVQLPRRQIIQNVCVWKYRGDECGYTGTNYFNANDVSVATAGLDVCGKRLSSCKARFGQYAELPFGSFPSAGLAR